MAGRLDQVSQVDDSVLGPFDGWVAAARWPASEGLDLSGF